MICALVFVGCKRPVRGAIRLRSVPAGLALGLVPGEDAARAPTSVRICHVSNGAASQAYRDNYEATFGRKRKPRKVKA